MAYGTINAEQLTTQSGYTLGAGNASSFKNRIINGAMVIDQRNAGASVTPPNGGAYTLDRWSAEVTLTGKLSVQQNAGGVTAPVGFVNYLGVTSLSAYAVPVDGQYQLRQFIEGYNIADLNWGTANAKTVNLSFWVRSSLTGTFGGSLRNVDSNRSYPFSYTISASNTWEQKTITIAGDTTGTWNTTNDRGIALFFGLGVGTNRSGTAGAWAAANYTSATGATSVVGTNGATFYITGVQLEVGTVATSFDYRSYPTELSICQRYYETQIQNSDLAEFSSYSVGGGYFASYWQFKVTKRATPTFALVGAGSWNVATPTIYPSVSSVRFITNLGQYALGGTNATAVASVSSEL